MKALEQVAVGDRDEFDDRLSLGDGLIVSGHEAWAGSIEKILNDNLYGASVASNGYQVIERLKHTWFHLVLIDLDSIDVPEDHLATNIRKIELYIPIIGLGDHSGGPCPNITYLKKPLTLELIKNYFQKIVSEKETKGGRKALNGLILAFCLSIIFWILLFWIWK